MKQQTVQHISDYLLHHRASRHSPHTIAHYTNTLNKFSAWLDTTMADAGGSSTASVTPAVMRGYLSYINDQFKPSTVVGIVQDLKAFFNFLHAEGEIPTNPMLRIRTPRKDQLVLEAFTRDEIRAMMQYTANRSRDRAILLVLLDSGVRLQELTNMMVEDVDFETGQFKVLGKGRKERLCQLSPYTLKAVLKYVREYKVPQGTGSRLWMGSKGPLGRYTLAHMVSRCGRNAGCVASPHKFRRTCALTMLKSGCSVYSIQLLLGHSDLTILRRYLAVTSADSIRDHAKFSAVGSLV